MGKIEILDMKKNSNPQTVVHNQEVCMEKNSMQEKNQVAERQYCIYSDKDMELYLKLHIANHKPG